MYVGQPNRVFREGLTHFGFYADGAIQPYVPRIKRHIPVVRFTSADAASQPAAGEQRVGDVIDRLLDEGARMDGESYCLLLLSGPDDPATVVLEHPIANDTVTANGRNWAWTLGQRYTRLDRLRSGVRRTSELYPGR